MECLEFRRLCGSDPHNEDPLFVAHAESCSRCAAYAREMRAFDNLLLQALEVEPPDASAIPVGISTEEAAQPGGAFWRPVRWLGLAASLVLVAGLAAGIWVGTSSDTLARDIVEHIHHEPKSLVTTDVSVRSEDIYRVMNRAGYRLRDDVALVTYTRTCIFRGQKVPHLVIQGRQGPITVMLLPEIDVARTISVDEDGFVGTIVPFDEGSLAVIGEPGEDLKIMTAQLVEGIERSN